MRTKHMEVAIRLVVGASHKCSRPIPTRYVPSLHVTSKQGITLLDQNMTRGTRDTLHRHGGVNEALRGLVTHDDAAYKSSVVPTRTVSVTSGPSLHSQGDSTRPVQVLECYILCRLNLNHAIAWPPTRRRNVGDETKRRAAPLLVWAHRDPGLWPEAWQLWVAVVVGHLDENVRQYEICDVTQVKSVRAPWAGQWHRAVKDKVPTSWTADRDIRHSRRRGCPVAGGN
jgi:hypothetical protein